MSAAALLLVAALAAIAAALIFVAYTIGRVRQAVADLEDEVRRARFEGRSRDGLRVAAEHAHAQLGESLRR